MSAVEDFDGPCVNPYAPAPVRVWKPRCEVTGKVIYRDRIDALNAVRYGNARWGINNLNHYLCGGCGKFHIGKSRK